MKTYIDYEKEAKEKLLNYMKSQLKHEGDYIQLSEHGEKMYSEKDFKKYWHLIRARYKEMARREFKDSQKLELQYIEPNHRIPLNGIELTDEPIPILAPLGLEETDDFTEPMIVAGLFQALMNEKNDYYLKLLRSIKIDTKNLTPDMKDILAGKYKGWEDE